MKLKHCISINQPAESAWRVLGERFGDLSWSSTIAESRLEGGPEVQPSVGSSRVCRSANSFGPFPASVITEKLTRFDPTNMEFKYEAITGLPGFVRYASNHWKIKAVDATRCTITSSAELRLAWWATPLGLLMPILLKSDMKSFFQELRQAIEMETTCSLQNVSAS